MELAKFLNKDTEPTIIFYGGEPTMSLNTMMWIMDNIPAKAYMMQTNGLFLDKLGPEYCRRFHTVLVSIDGSENLTNYYRGNGVYQKIIRNLKLLRNRGFRGEFIARMTIDPETNLHEAVNWLLYNPEFPFESVHWQLDAQFWRSDYQRERIRSWFERYNREVQNLIEEWVSYIEITGKVMRIYPFIGITESLLTTTSSKLRCGAGHTVFNIQTDGKITPCPVLAGIKDYYLGNIWDTDPQSLRDTARVKEPCLHCSIVELCGGRCLYANATKLWGDEGYHLICGTVEYLINSLKAVQPRIRQAISSGRVPITDFNYPKYNSCEIIP
jgi:putative peptide-modifying radical SAM enzyme